MLKLVLYPLLTLLFAAPLIAAQVPRGSQQEDIRDFTGGLVSNPKGWKVDKKFSLNMLNVRVDEKPGSIRTRKGFVALGSTNTVSYFKDGWEFVDPVSGEKGFYLFGSTTPQATAGSGILLFTRDFVNYTLVKSGLSALVAMDAAQVRQEMWFTNKTNAVFRHDGVTTTVTMDGTNGTPNVPRGALIAYYLDLVMIANITNDEKLLRWSLANDTSPARTAIAPSHYLAWPAANGLYAGQGDGHPLTAMRVYNGYLSASQDNGMWRLYGTGANSFQWRRVNNQVGFISQAGITELDGLLYGQGPDGLYKSDGSNMVRISDPFYDRAEDFRVDTTRVIFDEWQTEADFGAGSFSRTTTTAGGPISLQNSLYLFENPPDQNFDLAAGQSTTCYSAAFPPVASDTNTATIYAAHISTALVDFDLLPEGGGSDAELVVVASNTRTGAFESHSEGPLAGGRTFDFNASSQAHTIIWEGSDFDPDGGSSVVFHTYNLGPRTVRFKRNVCSRGVTFIPVTTGQFISDVSTASPITAWGTFESNFLTNSGAVSFFMRFATSPVNLSTLAWTPIVPGAVIAATVSANVYQWAATMSATDFLNPPRISYVAADYINGSGANTRSFATTWMGRAWIGVSTETSGNFPVIYEKMRGSGNDYFQPMAGLNLRGLFISGPILYGVAAASGVVYSMDVGTNDNGKAIFSYYETPDLQLGDVDYKKRIWEYLVDADPDSVGTLRIGTSMDGGAFSYNTINLSGSGRQTYSVKNPGGFGLTYGKMYRIRFEGSQLDHPIGVNGLKVIYVPSQIR